MKTFARDRRGNIFMIFGFALVPITFATGMGVDYAAAMRIQTKVAAVADAAALSGVGKTLMQTKQMNACYAARLLFETQAPSTGLTLDTTKASDLTIVVTDSPTNGGADVVLTCPVIVPKIDDLSLISIKKRTVKVTWAGTSKNTFSGVLGMTTLPVKGTATAQSSIAPFIDVHLVLDTSQSMGLPSTDQGARDLWKLTGTINGRSCQFGCHEVTPGEKMANEEIARQNNISLRVNVEGNAASDMITTAKTSQGSDSLYRFGVYRFGTLLSDVKLLTGDLDSVQSTVKALTLGPNNGAIGYGDTNLEDVLTGMKTRILIHGDGSTQAQARAFMFIVTDGVQDLCSNSHCMKLLDPAMCDWYKNNNTTVGIVYTTYLPVKSNPLDPNDPSLRFEYTWLISPLPPEQIAPKLQACASPGWFFEGSDGTTIHAAMQKLFAQASQMATITH